MPLTPARTCGKRSSMPDKQLDQDQTPLGGDSPSRTRSSSGTRTDLTVVAIGASAGGLDACRRLLDSLPASTGMAFILIQHLDPTHVSMLVSLLASHTKMVVLEAMEGLPIEPDHLYIIPPGAYLSVANGVLHVS